MSLAVRNHDNESQACLKPQRCTTLRKVEAQAHHSALRCCRSGREGSGSFPGQESGGELYLLSSQTRPGDIYLSVKRSRRAFRLLKTICARGSTPGMAQVE